jgi:hypothetical protein
VPGTPDEPELVLASELRPLIGLSQEQVQLAWERAAQNAGGRKITAQMVKAAVKELQPAGNAKPVTRQPRQNSTKTLVTGGNGVGRGLLSAGSLTSCERQVRA